MAKSMVHNAELIAAIERALGINADVVRRVVIDIRAGDLPIVYTELFGDETGLLNVVEALSSVEIERK